MRALIEQIFGTYTPIYTQEVVNIGGVDQIITCIAPGSSGVDWSYVLGVLGFFLVLWCVLRIIGAVISKC